MKGFYDHLNSWLRRKEAEKFGTDSFGKTAVRVIGNLTATILGLTVKTPFMQNVSAVNAGTEYSITIPAASRRFELKARGSALIKYSFIAGTSNTVYGTIDPGSSWKEEGIVTTVPVIVYFNTNKNNEIVELRSWTD